MPDAAGAATAKRRFWNPPWWTNIWERIFEVISNERSPNRVLTPLKNTSKSVPKRSSDFQNLRQRMEDESGQLNVHVIGWVNPCEARIYVTHVIGWVSP
jgi:hypothetical protein